MNRWIGYGWLGVLAVILVSSRPVAAQVNWEAPGGETGGTVNAIVVDPRTNVVYAGGTFLRIGGIDANFIARYDGTSWQSLGTGMNDWVFSLALDSSGTLYAGGRFTEAGGVPARRVARWNGTVWEAVGFGMNNPVEALVFDTSGTLYAGGGYRLFTNDGTDVDRSGGNIARWNGFAWNYLGSGTENSVYALAADTSGGVYVAGAFATVNGNPANRIARWDSLGWHTMGEGLNDIVYALAYDTTTSTLYAGGSFTASGATGLSHVARWDTTNGWTAIGTGAAANVYALGFDHDGILYSGGDFEQAGGIDASRIARWNGSQWLSMDGGPNGRVLAIAADTTDLVFVGGGFSHVSTERLPYLATWSGAVGTDVEDDDDALPETYELSQAYPNPFNPRAQFTLDVKETQPVRIEVYDMLGRRVALLYQGVLSAGTTHTFTLEAGNLPTGVYTYLAVGDHFRAARNVVLVK